MASSTLTQIPLRCDICPKKPRFSDVSHLLTHISSKTHLSNIFKAKVRADVDTESRRSVEDYEQWYAEWSIQDLLAERLSQKDNKTPKPRGRGKRKRAVSTEPSATVPPREPPTLHHQDIENQKFTFASTTPLQHFHPYAMRSAPDIPNLYLPGQTWAGLNQGGGYTGLFPSSRIATHGQAPPLYGYSLASTMPPVPPSLILPTQTTAYPDPEQFALPLGEVIDEEVSEPRRRSKRVELRSSTRIVKQEERMTDESSTDLDTISQLPPSEPNPAIDTIDEALATPVLGPRVALKGTVYPGMDCHDAATPEQRVQRNQRKSSEQYNRLEASSITAAQSPLEVVFLLEGGRLVYEKQHEITGQPTPSELDESSPPPEMIEPKKKRAPRQRYANKKAIAKSKNTKIEDEIEQGVAYGKRKRQFSVYTGEGSDSQSGRTSQHFPLGFQAHRRFQVDQEQENHRSYAGISASTAKSDDDGFESMNRIIPSIENSLERGSEGFLSRRMNVVANHFANNTATQLPYPTVHTTPSTFGHFSNHALVDLNSANENAGTAYPEVPYPYSFPNGPAYLHPFTQERPETPNMSGNLDSDTHNRLDSLAAAASRDIHLPTPAHVPAFRGNADTAYQPSVFHSHSHGPAYLTHQRSGSYHSQLSPNREWSLPPPLAPGLNYPYASHGRHPSMLGNLNLLTTRPFDSPEPFNRLNEGIVGRHESTLPPFLQPSHQWSLERPSRNLFGANDSYGFVTLFDNQQPHQYLSNGPAGREHDSSEKSSADVNGRHQSESAVRQPSLASSRAHSPKHPSMPVVLSGVPVEATTIAQAGAATSSSLSDPIDGEIDEDRTITAPSTPKIG